MRRRNPETVIVAVLLAASGVLLGLFVGSWFVLFVLVLMLGPGAGPREDVQGRAGEVAKRFNISRDVLERWVNGTTTPPPMILEAIRVRRGWYHIVVDATTKTAESRTKTAQNRK